MQKKESKGLDLGCGIGNITYPLSYLGYKMVGIDISETNIKIAKSKSFKGLNPQFFVGNAENLDLNNIFDFCICSEVLEHLNQPQKVLNTLNHLLKDNGIIIVTIPNGYGPYSLCHDHFRNKIISKLLPIGKSDHLKYFSYNLYNKFIKKNKFQNY
ncbi:MAG: hypothetical protein Kow0019_15700 [Methanobacteriaceae archaeon]